MSSSGERPGVPPSGENVTPHRSRLLWAVAVALVLTPLSPRASRAQQIPKAAWSRGIGEPLANPGHPSVPGLIDDSYWQGVPIGGFGSGSIGRTYRGDFARWNLKVGVHKYESVAPDVFAAYEHEQGAQPVAVVLRAGKPSGPGS